MDPSFLLALVLLSNPANDQVDGIVDIIDRTELVDVKTGTNYGHVLVYERADIEILCAYMHRILGDNYAVKVNPYRLALKRDWHVAPKIAERLIGEAIEADKASHVEQ